MRTFRKLIACVLILSMLLSLGTVLSFAQFGEASGGAPLAKGFKSESFRELNEYKYSDDDIVTAIVVLKGAAVIDSAAYGETIASRRRTQIEDQQAAVLGNMSKKGIDYKFIYKYTELLNGFSAEIRYGDLDAVSAMNGVDSVYISNYYDIPDDKIETKYANDMVGATDMHTAGYNGEGTVIAVLDTGLNTTHEAFRDYGITSPVITEERVNELIAAEDHSIENGLYLSEKVPFTYDYADLDNDVTDHNGHGSHVAGLAAGYTEDELGAVTFNGSAPAAQLVFMKIFKDAGGGTNSSIYFKAIEDAYLLGADVISMSIGSSCGFTYDYELDTAVFGNIYEKLDNAGVIVSIAAGNENSQAESSTNFASLLGYTMVPNYYTDYGVIGSPSTYSGNLSVAAAQNNAYPDYAITVDGLNYVYHDGSDDGSGNGLFLNTFAGQTLEYVMVPNTGTAEDYEGLDVEGKVAVVNRGVTTFNEKLATAAEHGAVAMICVNNAAGSFGMSIDPYTIPAVSVTKTVGIALGLANVKELTVTGEVSVVVNEAQGLMCDFSSWGVTSDLKFGPMITGVGGNLYSVGLGSDDAYALMSGTSMACPNTSGCMASLLSYIKAEYPTLTKAERAEFAEALSESTANLLNAENGVYYSPRKQGAGLVNISNAAQADAYITNPLQALGDDPDKDGFYSFTLTLKNLTDSDLSYAINTTMLEDYIADLTEDLGGSDTEKYYYNTLTSALINDSTVTTDALNDVVTVPANSTADVTVNISLSVVELDLLREYKPYGAFIDGFVFFNQVDGAGEPVADAVPLHASFFAFWGDWTASPYLESVYYYDYVNLASMGYGDYLTQIYEVNTGLYNEAYLGLITPEKTSLKSILGDNLFDYLPFDFNHVAISNNEGTAGENFVGNAVVMFPALMRNAEHLVMIVTDSETGEVYYIDDTAFAKKNTFNADEGVWEAATTFIWDGTDLSSEYVSNGTVANIEYFVISDYNDNGTYKTADQFATPEEFYAQLVTLSYSVWTTSVLVDNQAPVFDSIKYDKATGMLYLSAADNGSLQAAMAVETTDYSTTDAVLLDGSDADLTFDFDAISAGNDNVIIELYDYASNFADYYVMVDKETGIAMLFDLNTSEVLLYSAPNGSGIAYLNLNDSVNVKLSDDFAQPADAETGIRVNLSDALDLIGDSGKSLVVDFEDYSLTFDADATGALLDAYAGGTPVLLSIQTKFLAGSAYFTFDISGIDFSAGSATLALNRLDPAYSFTNNAYYIDDDGYFNPMTLDFSADGTSVYLDTTHFSTFVITTLSGDALTAQYYTVRAEQTVISYIDIQATIDTVNAARNAAEAAQAKAELAQAKAEAAKADAEAAQAAAEAAKTGSEAAEANAETAQAAAEASKLAAANAQTAAETANTNAQTALTNAEAAKADAIAAKTAAETAQAAAETAKADAVAAKTDAEAAKAEAVTAKTDAEAAKTAAEAAKAEAVTAKTDAEAAKTAAEAAKAEALTAAEAAKAAQLAAETSEDNTEALKAAAEAAKTAAEAAQAKAEAAETAAKTAETAAEAAQAKAETAEDSAVAAQVKAEEAQNKAETAQNKAETAQSKAEAAQSKAETAENGAKAAQTAAETAKSKAETAKTAAETAKANAETAQTKAETAKAAAETAKTAAEAAQAKAETAKTAAEATANTAKESADAAKASADAAKASEDAAKASADAAKASEDAAKASADAAKASEDAAKANADEAKANADAAKASADAAKASEDTVKANADAAKASEDAVKANADAATSAKADAESAKTAAEAAKTAAEAAKTDANAILDEVKAEKEKGCGAVAGIGSALVIFMSFAAAAFTVKKKHN